MTIVPIKVSGGYVELSYGLKKTGQISIFIEDLLRNAVIFRTEWNP